MTRDGGCQHTVEVAVEARGIGLHSGAAVTVRLLPAPADQGLVFERKDLPGRPRVPVAPEYVHVNGLERRTELAGDDGTRIATPEHLLAACVGLGIDNLRVELDGPELPIFDGSAAPWVELLDRAGRSAQNAQRRWWRLRRPVTLMGEGADIVALPAERPRYAVFTLLRHAGIADQRAAYVPGQDDFRKNVAPARTFCFYEELQALKDRGLIKGGSLECALVMRDGQPYQNKLRMANELATHKLLDLIGDFAILGRPLAAHISARGSGHAFHYGFIRILKEELLG